MGRTRGQVEKFPFQGLEWNDIRRILVRGENGRRSGFSELEELEASLDVVFDGQPNKLDLTEAEAIAMIEDVSEYPHELQFRIGQRIDELETADDADGEKAIDFQDRAEGIEVLKDLGRRLESINASPLGSEALCETIPVSDQRLFAFEAYIEIAKKLGRVPFRAEIEAVQTGEYKGRALSRAVERLGLRMADKRIWMRLDRVLPTVDLPLGEQRSCRSAGRAISEVLSKLSGGSPELKLMRRSLRDSDFDRLVGLISDKRLHSVIGDEIALVSKESSEAKELRIGPQEDVVISFGPKHLVIDGRKETVELLEAIRALFQVWTRVRSFALDLSWVQPDEKPDFDCVLDLLILSSTIMGEDSRRSVACWISRVLGQPYLKTLVPGVLQKVWRPPSTLMRMWVDLAAGIEHLLNGIQGHRTADGIRFDHLLAENPTFSQLVQFLEPFDTILKIDDYGLEVPGQLLPGRHP